MKATIRIFITTASALLILFATTACKSKNQEVSHEEAALLFEKSLKLIEAYTDSFLNAKDSAHVNKLALTFEAKINNLNFEFSPNTDLNLTQEENDSLIKVTDKLVAQQRLRLSSFAKQSNDSIAEDGARQVPESL